MSIEQEVSEFIIVAPARLRPSLEGARDAALDYLRRQFPGYTFHISPVSPLDHDDYLVLPVMNFVADDGKSHMCNPPSYMLKAAIADAIANFRVPMPRLN